MVGRGVSFELGSGETGALSESLNVHSEDALEDESLSDLGSVMNDVLVDEGDVHRDALRSEGCLGSDDTLRVVLRGHLDERKTFGAVGERRDDLLLDDSELAGEGSDDQGGVRSHNGGVHVHSFV